MPLPAIKPRKMRFHRKRQSLPVPLGPENSNGFVDIAFGGAPGNPWMHFDDDVTAFDADVTHYTCILDGVTVVPSAVAQADVRHIVLITSHGAATHAIVTILHPENFTFDNGLPMRPPFTRSL